MDFYQYVMFISSVVLSVQLVPQNYKIYKSKSAKDISYVTIMITLSGISGIISYGVHMDLMEIWVPPIIQIGLSVHTLLMKIYYDNFYEMEDIYIGEEIDSNITSHVTIGITGNLDWNPSNRIDFD